MKPYKLLNDLFKKHGITYSLWLYDGNPDAVERFKDFSNIKVSIDNDKVKFKNFSQWYVEIQTPEGLYDLRRGLNGTSVERFIRNFLRTYVRDNPDFKTALDIGTSSMVFKNNKDGRFYFQTDSDNILTLSTKDENTSSDYMSYVRFLKRLGNVFNLNTYDTDKFETLFIKEVVMYNIGDQEVDLKPIDLKPFTRGTVDFTKPNTDPNKVYVIRNDNAYGYFTITDSERNSFHTCQATGHYLTGLSNNDNERMEVGGLYYTSAYYNANRKTCVHCGTNHFGGVEFKLDMCLSCYHRVENDFNSVGITMPDNVDEIRKAFSMVKSYDYSPEFNMLNIAKARSPLYMGVELEVDTGGRYDDNDDYDDYDDEDNRYDSGKNYTREKQNLIASKALNILSPDGNAYAMWDGSLINGFEIATHPATLESHLKAFDYETAFNYLKSKGYMSHDSGTCGLHVHIGRRFFGKTKADQLIGIGKMAYLVEKHWDRFVAFSRRTDDQLDQWARRSSILYRLKDELLEDDRNAAVAVLSTYGNQGKYSAVNLQHRNTVELRMFRGTLNYKTFIATLTMVDSLARLAKKLSLKDLTFIEFSDIINYSGSEIVKNYWNTKEGD